MAPTTRQALAALSDTVKLTVLVTYDKADKTGVSVSSQFTRYGFLVDECASRSSSHVPLSR